MTKQSKGFWETACARCTHWPSCKADLETGRTRFPALEETEKLVLVKTPDRSLSLKQSELHAPQGKRLPALLRQRHQKRPKKKAEKASEAF
jgi:hypothetical protein